MLGCTETTDIPKTITAAIPEECHAPQYLTARYAIPIVGPVQSHPLITVDAGRISRIEPYRADNPPRPVSDLGNVAILPALVNAHAHLEFSDLQAPLGRPGIPFPDWIRGVIANRRNQSIDRMIRIRQGMNESIQAGVGYVGEIVSLGAAPSLENLGGEYPPPPPQLTLFWESIAFRNDRIEAAAQAAREWLDASRRQTGPHQIGLSPHAPYTVAPSLLEKLVDRSIDHCVPMAMHLAESPEEMELLRSGTGGLRDLLRELNAWEEGTLPLNGRPLQYLQILAKAPRAQIIHGNYLDGTEIEFLGEHADTMSLVFCPRTHAYFKHVPFPLERMLKLGVIVALGTDGRSSNPDLNLLEEMRRVRRDFPAVDPLVILKMGTLWGARSLGMDRDWGSLESGKLARFAIVPLPADPAVDPVEAILQPESPPASLIETGR